MKDNSIRKHILRILGSDVQKELTAMCSLKNESILRSMKPSSLSKFSWNALGNELEHTAPTLYAFLDGSLQVHMCHSQQLRRKTEKSRRASKAAIIGICAAILCRYICV